MRHQVQPSHQDYSTPTHHETNHHSHHAKEKGLPDTGNDDSTHNVTLFGGLLALIRFFILLRKQT